MLEPHADPSKAVSRAFTAAVKALPGPRAVLTMQAAIDRAINAPAPPAVDVEMPDVGAEALADWEEGTSKFRHFRGEQLDQIIGWNGDGSERDGPMFNTHIDPKRELDPHTTPEKFWAALDKGQLEPLRLLWAQKLGCTCAVDNVLRGLPFICLDDVGLGKTIQAASIIAALEFMREAKDKHPQHQWPGSFGMCSSAPYSTFSS